jgi:hypothetical protein
VRKWIAVVALALASCNPDLKAEKQVMERLGEQERALSTRIKECWDQEGMTEIDKQSKVAAAACKPFADALNAVKMPELDPSNPGPWRQANKKWMAAYEAREKEPSCKEEKRLRGLWLKQFEPAKRCYQPAANELEIRKAEFMAACQKCAVKERCEENLKHNLTVIDRRFIAERNPEKLAPEARQKAADEQQIYACQK